jgi:hypothetical protein
MTNKAYGGGLQQATGGSRLKQSAMRCIWRRRSGRNQAYAWVARRLPDAMLGFGRFCTSSLDCCLCQHSGFCPAPIGSAGPVSCLCCFPQSLARQAIPGWHGCLTTMDRYVSRYYLLACRRFACTYHCTSDMVHSAHPGEDGAAIRYVTRIIQAG